MGSIGVHYLCSIPLKSVIDIIDSYKWGIHGDCYVTPDMRRPHLNYTEFHFTSFTLEGYKFHQLLQFGVQVMDGMEFYHILTPEEWDSFESK